MAEELISVWIYSHFRSDEICILRLTPILKNKAKKMFIGNRFFGQVKTQEGQCIETNFFCIGLPLYVTDTMLVTESEYRKRKGIIIKTNHISIIASIIRIISIIISFFSIGFYLGNDIDWLIFPMLLSIVIFIYSWFYFGRTTKYERFVRGHFGKQLGLFIMPEWFRPYELKSHFEKMRKSYVSTFGVSDWKEKIKSVSIYDEEFSLAFCITALENATIKNSETDILLREIVKKEL